MRSVASGLSFMPPGDNATLSTYVDELEGEVEVLQAANEGLESEADKNSEKLKAKAAEAAQYRAELVFNENRLAELEEKLQDYDDDVALSANSKARKQAEADQDADYTEETGEDKRPVVSIGSKCARLRCRTTCPSASPHPGSFRA